jgi:chromosomal replication initiation ATPase DnaA
MSADNTRYSIPFTPLSERIASDTPHLAEPLAALRQAMGDADFETYIDSLSSLRKVDDQLLLITRREMNRSILMSRYLPLIKETFGVSYIRIVSQ